MEVLRLPPDSAAGQRLFFDAPPMPAGPHLTQPPLPMGPPPQQQQRHDAAPPPGFQQHAQQQQQHQQQQYQQQSNAAAQAKRRKKRGWRGGGGGGGGVQKRRGDTQLGFFGQVPDRKAPNGQMPSLSDMREENRRRMQQHYGGGIAGLPRPFSGGPKQHGPGRAGSHRRARGKAAKQKMPQPPSAPRPKPLTPAAGNPLDTPANVGQATDGGPAGKPEVEGLQAGLDWYGTNENSTALFLTGQQLTTSDSDAEDYGEEFGEEGSEGDGDGDGEVGARGGDAGADGAEGAAVPRQLRARLVEQEAYIAELEDQNLRLREQLEMVQQELEEARARGGGGPMDSEEGWAEHSEGSLPGDFSVVQQQQHSQAHHSQAH